jgi:hypothetical protein
MTVAVDRGSWIVGLSTLSDAELFAAHAEGEQMQREAKHSSPHLLLIPQLAMSVVYMKDEDQGRVRLESVDSLERVLVLDDQDVRAAENAHVKGERIWDPPLHPMDMLRILSAESIGILVEAYNAMNSALLFGTHRRREARLRGNVAQIAVVDEPLA